MNQAPPIQDLDIIGLLTRPGTYVLAMAIYISTFFIKRMVQTAMPWLAKQHDANSPKVTYLTSGARWWNEVILYMLPVVLGVLVGAFIHSEFFFDGIGDKGGRLGFGGGVGWFSGILYKILNKLMKQRAGLELSPPTGDSDAPPRP
jgi:hypothetical protein